MIADVFQSKEKKKGVVICCPAHCYSLQKMYDCSTLLYAIFVWKLTCPLLKKIIEIEEYDVLICTAPY